MRRVRILPYSVYDVPAMECWLEEMARKGLHLDDILGQYAYFCKGEPAEVRYRLEPWSDSAPELDEEMESVYAAAGWEYVQKVVGENFHLWRSTRPDARELHDDPIVRSYGFEWAEKRAKRMFWLAMGVVLIMVGLVVALAWYDGVRPWPYPWPRTELPPVGERILRTVLETPYLMFMPFWVFSWSVMDLLSARRVRLALQTGVPLERKPGGFPYKRAVFWLIALLLILYVPAMMLWYY